LKVELLALCRFGAGIINLLSHCPLAGYQSPLEGLSIVPLPYQHLCKPFLVKPLRLVVIWNTFITYVSFHQLPKMGSKAPKKDDFDPQVPHERKEERPDFSVPPPPKKLPKELQDNLDNDEKLLDMIYDGT
jgi:hypothetical protein